MVLIRPAAKEAPPAELRKQLRDVLVKAKLLEIV